MSGPSVIGAQDFDPEERAKELKDSLNHMRSDEDLVTYILAGHNNAQRQQIKDYYKTAFGEELEEDLKSNLRGEFQDVCLALMMPPPLYDATELRKAMKGPGTDDATVIEIMCSRENREIDAIRDTYNSVFERNLEDDLKDDTRGDFKRLLVSQCNAGRDESTKVDSGQAQEDAQALYDAGAESWGTDESVFNMILCLRSYAQLRATFNVYADIAGQDIEESIKKEMRGNMEKGMLTIVKYAKNPAIYYAELLNDSLRGLGSDEEALTRAVITRCEKDMQAIKRAYQDHYEKSLNEAIDDDCRRDYKKVLIALVNGV